MDIVSSLGGFVLMLSELFHHHVQTILILAFNAILSIIGKKKSLFLAQNLRDVDALRVRSKDISCKE